jgi:hypothetical protein
MGGSRVPLAAELIAGLEDRHVKARLQRMLGGNETARAGAHDRYTCTGSQPHAGDAIRSGDAQFALGASVSKPRYRANPDES